MRSGRTCFFGKYSGLATREEAQAPPFTLFSLKNRRPPTPSSEWRTEISCTPTPPRPIQKYMATASDVRAPSAGPAQLPFSVRYLLRIEGLAVAVVSAVLYARTGASWWLFAALWLAPDFSLLGCLASPRRGPR